MFFSFFPISPPTALLTHYLVADLPLLHLEAHTVIRDIRNRSSPVATAAHILFLCWFNTPPPPSTEGNFITMSLEH